MDPMENNDGRQRADPGEVPAKGLPEISYRQLEVFSVTCREQSYANAALELHSTRANIKRVCQDFERAVGRRLFEERPDRALVPTPFAQGLLVQVGPLARSLRRLGEGVRGLHQEGRVLRFAAAGGFFRGGLFTGFLASLKTADLFRACFVRIEVKRFRTALLNAECDVYFGIGLGGADRLDPVDLGPVPWRIVRPPQARGPVPATPEQLGKWPWWIAATGEPEVADALLAALREAGARGGAVAGEEEAARLAGDPAELPAHGCLLVPDMAAGLSGRSDGSWPCYRLTACLRRNHPYAELKPRLLEAARACGHGH
jgi:DNA-binding transcriptional LysR family regulator